MASRANYFSRRSRRLAFHQLEERTMMAGDVEAHVSALGDLRITGDNNDNAIQIVQTIENGVPVAGSYTVIGNSTANTTTINGQTSQTFTGVTHDINISTGNGVDRVFLGSMTVAYDPPTGNFNIPHDLIVSTGTGGLSGTGGASHVRLNGVSVGNNVLIATQFEDDDIWVNAAIQNDLTIFSGGGADSIWVHDTLVGHNVSIDTSSSNTSRVAVTLEAVHANNLTIKTGAGGDYVGLSKVGVRNLSILTDKGHDTVDVEYVIATESFFANLGEGIDTLNVTETRGGQLKLDGGDGLRDSLNTSKMNFKGVRSIGGFEYQRVTTALF